MSKAPQPVRSLAGLSLFPFEPEGGSERFGARICSFGAMLGLDRLGAMYTEVPPGKRAFPFHNHLANDEMFVILSGRGEYRIGDEVHPVVAGDVCGAPHGGPDTAHQLINTGDAPLTYISISTRIDPEIVEYPDSGKFAAMAIAPGRNLTDAHLRSLHSAKESLGYWDGEDL